MEWWGPPASQGSDGWQWPYAHGETFCEHCRDRHDISLVIDKQLQRVRGRLLHRATKTEESDAPLPLPAICVAALRHRSRQQEAARGKSWRRLARHRHDLHDPLRR
ncbi:hypothetical protein ACQEUX_11625 [Micromonospora sp. CA-259024]|uniref:hypothetical protein n=1 Tax=Micromonospora sp. CA-259024 TaxID=3239965 RepID=UPI003D9409F8